MADGEVLWKCFFVFNFLFFLLWVTFYTYQPWFLTNSDFIAPGDNNRDSSDKNRSDKYLSDPGRNYIYLASLITALVASILLYIFMVYFSKRRYIRCDEDATSLRDCELMGG